MICSIPNCGRPVKSRGWCDRHYKRWWRWGDPLGKQPRLQRPRGLNEAETFAWFMPGDPPVTDSLTEGCWDWTGTTDQDGYGAFIITIDGKAHGTRAHGASYRIYHGATNGLQVLHWCDRPICVHPAHLHLGDNDMNRREMVERERQARGERVGTSRFTAADIIMIRQSPLTQVALAKQFNTSQGAISNIILRKSWKHI